jgi:hypothetical protein
LISLEFEVLSPLFAYIISYLSGNIALDTKIPSADNSTNGISEKNQIFHVISNNTTLAMLINQHDTITWMIWFNFISRFMRPTTIKLAMTQNIFVRAKDFTGTLSSQYIAKRILPE